MRIDLHVHLSPHSRGSDFTLDAYCEQIKRRRLRVVTVTDYGTAKGAEELERRVGGILVVYGAEIATHEGQFLLFSSDRKLFGRLPARLKTLDDVPRSAKTAVVWTHPRLPWRNGWRAPLPRQPLTKFIFERVDGVEYFNGAMLAMGARGAVEPRYHERLSEQIERWNVAAVGGSACQTAAGFFSAWTTTPSVRTPQEFITAIKDRAVKPGAVLTPALRAV